MAKTRAAICDDDNNYMGRLVPRTVQENNSSAAPGNIPTGKVDIAGRTKPPLAGAPSE